MTNDIDLTPNDSEEDTGTTVNIGDSLKARKVTVTIKTPDGERTVDDIDVPEDSIFFQTNDE